MTAHHVDLVLADIAARQEALWSGRQAVEAGASHSFIHRRIDSGRWIDHGHRVYGPPGVPWSHLRRLWEAHIATGAEGVISHQAAAVVHEFAGFGGSPIVVTRRHSSNTRFNRITVHQITDCVDEHRMSIGGLPVTTAARTLVDLAAVSARTRLREAVEDAVSARVVTLDQVDSVLRSVARRGKPGVLRLISVLDEQAGAPPPASELERRVRSALTRAGLSDPGAQQPLPGRGSIPGLVDFLYKEARLIVEADGRRWHDRRRSMLHDRDRDNEAAAAGYVTMRIMWERIVGDPIDTGKLIATTYASRLRLLSSAA